MDKIAMSRLSMKVDKIQRLIFCNFVTKAFVWILLFYFYFSFEVFTHLTVVYLESPPSGERRKLMEDLGDYEAQVHRTLGPLFTLGMMLMYARSLRRKEMPSVETISLLDACLSATQMCFLGGLIFYIFYSIITTMPLVVRALTLKGVNS